MGELEDLVLGLLRSSEELRVVLKTQLLLSSPFDTASVDSITATSEDTRILAIVSHQDDWSMTEEGRYVSHSKLCALSDLGTVTGISQQAHGHCLCVSFFHYISAYLQ
jgi:hypothetical protein